MRRLLSSMRYAISGFIYVVSKHNNFRIMTITAVIVVILGLLLDLTLIEWFFISWSITTVLIAEMVNTAVEHVIDLIHKKKDINAKLAKDIAAATVLLSVLWTIFIGAMIFIPKIIGRIF